MYCHNACLYKIPDVISYYKYISIECSFINMRAINFLTKSISLVKSETEMTVDSIVSRNTIVVIC